MHLSDYMARERLSDKDVAAQLGVSRPTVSRIRRRKANPSWDTIRAIDAFTRGKVTAGDFMVPAEAAE